MPDSDENTLRIETDGLDVTLRGSAEEVAEAYRALREVLTELFESTLEDDVPPPSGGEGLGDDGTAPLHRPPDSEESPPPNYSAAVRAMTDDVPAENEPRIVQLILLRSSHMKAHLIDRGELADSFLGRSLALADLRRLYADESVEDRLDETLELGTTVWRELTPEGRVRVEREAAAESEAASTEESRDS